MTEIQSIQENDVDMSSKRLFFAIPHTLHFPPTSSCKKCSISFSKRSFGEENF